MVSGVFKGQLSHGVVIQMVHLLFGRVVIIGGVSWMAAVVTITKDLMANKLSEETTSQRSS